MKEIEKWRPRDLFDPFADLVDFRDEMNRFFDRFFGRTPMRRVRRGEEFFSPLVDLYETPSELVAKVELPGMKKEEIEVSVVGDTLTLKGERKRESEVKEENFYRMERSYGTFQRSLTLPNPVDASKVKATYKDGILEVRVPKAEEAKPKLIKID